MELLDRFPRMAFREKKVVYSKEELEELLEEAKKINKLCIVSLYSFEEVKDRHAVIESAIINKMLWEGSLDYCEEICRKYKDYQRMILFDGEKYIAIVFKEATLEELEKEKACTDLGKMILLPGCINLKNKQVCRIVKEYGGKT